MYNDIEEEEKGVCLYRSKALTKNRSNFYD